DRANAERGASDRARRRRRLSPCRSCLGAGRRTRRRERHAGHGAQRSGGDRRLPRRRPRRSGMTTPLLDVRGIHAGYGGAEVLFGIDLTVAPGEIVGVLGRNGMGKTTLVRTIMGLLRPSAGTVALAGRDITGWAPNRIARAGVGLVPEG